GAASGTVGFLLAGEQLLLALVGGGLGYSLGILLARVVGQKIFGVAPAFSFLVLAVIVGLAAIVTLLGSAIPLRRASRYEPAPILRGELCPRRSPPSPTARCSGASSAPSLA